MRPEASREWIETNGLGGYAFGTSAGFPTRRYHGLLIAARKPPVDRRMLFGQLLAAVVSDGRQLLLDPNLESRGSGSVSNFVREPLPTTVYRVGGVTREIFMRYGHNTTVVRYRIGAKAKPIRLAVRVVPVFRDHNEIHDKENTENSNPPLSPLRKGGMNEIQNSSPLVKGGSRGVQVEAAFGNQIRMSCGEDRGFIFYSCGRYVDGFKNIGPVRYTWETRQGMADIEYFLSPGYVEAEITSEHGLDIILSDRPIRSANPDIWRKQELSRRGKILSKAKRSFGAGHSIAQTLSLAADQFLVERTPGRNLDIPVDSGTGPSLAGGRKKTIVAGYPWFTDWGRDTMISLEGLALVRGEFDAAAQILSAFAGAESRGMIPNHYPDAGEEPHYNTVDASLWFFEAGWKFLSYSKNAAFVRKTLYPVFRAIIRHHIGGTRFNIHAEPSTGFLFSGEEGTQLTWMDAKVDDWVVTPRHGYPVEIQALWYNALRIFGDLSRLFNIRDRLVLETEAISAKCSDSFLKTYFCPKGQYLFDCITPQGHPVDDLRPNQLMAMSLTHPIVDDRVIGGKILEAVRKNLLTPVGLRTLSPDHPKYKGRHEGTRLERDSAYHQGTVWPWLIGPYARACLYVEGNNRQTRSRLKRILAGFEKHLSTCAMGTVSEIFDGDPPHEPKACVAQAWSVAELLVLCRLARG